MILSEFNFAAFFDKKCGLNFVKTFGKFLGFASNPFFC